MSKRSYDADFYGWANEQAALLRAGRLGEADVGHIAEEIESMGRSEKRELTSRLVMLLAHLLKWRWQPGGRRSSWRASVRIERKRIGDHLEDNPSLKPLIPEAMSRAYDEALVIAGEETKLGEDAFPLTCPWSFDEIIHPDFWPE